MSCWRHQTYINLLNINATIIVVLFGNTEKRFIDVLSVLLKKKHLLEFIRHDKDGDNVNPNVLNISFEKWLETDIQLSLTNTTLDLNIRD